MTAVLFVSARVVPKLMPRTGARPLMIVGSAYSYLQEWLPHVAQYQVRQGLTDFVGLGRMVLSYPELPADVLAGATLQRSLFCRTFSDCTTGPRMGLVSGCYPLDPHYVQRADAVRIRDVRTRARESAAKAVLRAGDNTLVERDR